MRFHCCTGDDGGEMWSDIDGEYVVYADHAGEVQRLKDALTDIKAILGCAANDGKPASVKDANANHAWHIADRALNQQGATTGIIPQETQ